MIPPQPPKVRTADWQRMSDTENDAAVTVDNLYQRKWVELMQPSKAFLKFKLPYEDGKTEFFEGPLYFPVFGPATTTECRLVCDAKSKLVEYDHAVYSDELFFFNTVLRSSLYEHSVEVLGLCHCFDCKSEVVILGEYQRSFGATESIGALSSRLTAVIGGKSGRTLCSFEPNVAKRQQREQKKKMWRKKGKKRGAREGAFGAADGDALSDPEAVSFSHRSGAEQVLELAAAPVDSTPENVDPNDGPVSLKEVVLAPSSNPASDSEAEFEAESDAEELAKMQAAMGLPVGFSSVVPSQKKRRR